MTTTMDTGAASLSDERERAAITACALMIKGICLTRPNAEWTGAIEDRIQFMLKQMQAGAAIAAGGAQEAVAWVRYRSDGGFEGPIMDTDARMCDTRRSFWTPLYAEPLPRVAAAVMPDDTSAFKNFHRQLCERFGYVHDEKDWRRDQVSLIECIAKKLETVEKDSARYRRFRRWHPRLQTSYWTGKWWEPIYGEKMDVCVDWLDEVPQPTPHADQCDSAAPAASNGGQ